ncbi:MAG: hypothetical protein WCO84_01450 [bacterium]
MFSLCGYNFYGDENALDFTPTSINNIKTVEIKNGIFDHFQVTRDVTFAYTSVIPTTWSFLDIMSANFEGNINAGNVDLILEQITSIKIKRRTVGTFDWITLFEIPITTVNDLTFQKIDYFNQHGQNYEYAFVPTLNGVEGNYITNTVGSSFDGVFICDKETIFKYYAGVTYGTSEQVTKIGTFEPFGRKYPVVVANAITDYQKGSVDGTILSPSDYSTRIINNLADVVYRKELLTFLTNKKAKILKDWNGNFWLIIITDSPQINYMNDYSMGIANVGFNYSEIGDALNQADLYSTGLIDVASGV